jgi:hypothetical protein
MTVNFPDHEAPDSPTISVEIAMPISLHGQAEALRWNIERALRAFEEMQPQLGTAILYALVDKRNGLAYMLERHLAALEQTVTGIAP